MVHYNSRKERLVSFWTSIGIIATGCVLICIHTIVFPTVYYDTISAAWFQPIICPVSGNNNLLQLPPVSISTASSCPTSSSTEVCEITNSGVPQRFTPVAMNAVTHTMGKKGQMCPVLFVTSEFHNISIEEVSFHMSTTEGNMILNFTNSDGPINMTSQWPMFSSARPLISDKTWRSGILEHAETRHSWFRMDHGNDTAYGVLKESVFPAFFKIPVVLPEQFDPHRFSFPFSVLNGAYSKTADDVQQRGVDEEFLSAEAVAGMSINSAQYRKFACFEPETVRDNDAVVFEMTKLSLVYDDVPTRTQECPFERCPVSYGNASLDETPLADFGVNVFVAMYSGETASGPSIVVSALCIFIYNIIILVGIHRLFSRVPT